MRMNVCLECLSEILLITKQTYANIDIIANFMIEFKFGIIHIIIILDSEYSEKVISYLLRCICFLKNIFWVSKKGQSKNI